MLHPRAPERSAKFETDDVDGHWLLFRRQNGLQTSLLDIVTVKRERRYFSKRDASTFFVCLRLPIKEL